MSGLLQKRIVALVIIMTGLFPAVLIPGCSSDNSETSKFNSGADEITIEEQAIPLSQMDPTSINSAFEIPIPDAPGLLAEKNDQAFIDHSNKHYGYVTVGFLENTENNIKVMIVVPGGREYVYGLTPGSNEVFPLSDGDGRYIISIHEHVIDNIFRDVLSTTIYVELINEFVPFLHPSQYVSYCKESPVTAKAYELSMTNGNLVELIEAVYNFVVENISYDFEFAETVGVGYTPDLNKVLERGSGICLDMATLTTAMLRSQGIPSKLVFGYYYDSTLGNIYHAWVSVFSEEDGKIGESINIIGGTWNILDPSLVSILGMSETGVTVGDGKIYHDLYYY